MDFPNSGPSLETRGVHCGQQGFLKATKKPSKWWLVEDLNLTKTSETSGLNKLVKSSPTIQLMVNWWFGARWFGFPGSFYEMDCYWGVFLESQTTNPNHQLIINWKIISGEKTKTWICGAPLHKSKKKSCKRKSLKLDETDKTGWKCWIHSHLKK